jgi:hypothetical protein
MNGWKVSERNLNSIVTGNGTVITFGVGCVTFKTDDYKLPSLTISVEEGRLTTYQGHLESHQGKPMLFLAKNTGMLFTRVEIFEDQASAVVFSRHRYKYGPIELTAR